MCIKSYEIDSDLFYITIRIYYGIISFLTVSGNSFLIYALRRTGQTGTISFIYIIQMSMSDIIMGIACALQVTMSSFATFERYCWLKISVNLILGTCNFFSALMLLLIALDRYLHMTYLDRYSTIFTKKRGCSLAVVAVVFAAISSIHFVMQNKDPISMISSSVLHLLLVPVAIAIFLLYNRACKALASNTSQTARNITTQNRALGKAASRIMICFVCLSLPTVAVKLFFLLYKSGKMNESSIGKALSAFAYATFLGNGFCSSCIFISLNRRIKTLLKVMLNHNMNRIWGTLDAAQPNN